MSTLRAKLIRLAHANPVLRPHLLTVLAATTPLPDKFPSTEIGLMTWREFLEFRNPEGKMHESGSYDYSVEKMNDTLTLLTTEMGLKGTRYGLKGPYKGGTGYVIVKENHKLPRSKRYPHVAGISCTKITKIFMINKIYTFRY